MEKCKDCARLEAELKLKDEALKVLMAFKDAWCKEKEPGQEKVRDVIIPTAACDVGFTSPETPAPCNPLLCSADEPCDETCPKIKKASSKGGKEIAIVWDPATSSLTVKKGGKK